MSCSYCLDRPTTTLDSGNRKSPIGFPGAHTWICGNLQKNQIHTAPRVDENLGAEIRDNGKQCGKYYIILGLYLIRDDGKENGNYY